MCHRITAQPAESTPGVFGKPGDVLHSPTVTASGIVGTATTRLLCAVTLALALTAAANAQRTDPTLLDAIRGIKAIDNHAHPPALVAAGQKDGEFDALPCDPLPSCWSRSSRRICRRDARRSSIRRARCAISVKHRKAGFSFFS